MDEKNLSTEEVPSEDKSPEEEPKKKSLITRRDFLIGAGAGAAAGAVVAGAGVASLRSTTAPAPEAMVEEVSAPSEASSEEMAMAAPEELPANIRRVTLNINGEDHDVTTDVRWSLWEVLVFKLGMGGTKRGCDRAECGACAVTVDGKAVNGCTVLAARLGGKKIETVDGLASGATYEELHPIQRAYIEEGGFQCGICTSGFIMSTYALLQQNPDPSEDDVREALAGNICRCSEYPKVYESVFAAAEEMRG